MARTAAVLEGLEQALGARRPDAGSTALVRPRVGVLTTIDELRAVGNLREPAAFEGFLRSRGLGPSLDAIARVAESVAFFGVSAIGRVEFRRVISSELALRTSFADASDVPAYLEGIANALEAARVGYREGHRSLTLPKLCLANC